jgi:ABC-type uncharacterized transport system ATPase subunit
MQVSDRIAVLAHGTVAGITDARTVTRHELGNLMTSHNDEAGDAA